MITPLEAIKKISTDLMRPVTEIMRDIQMDAWKQGMTDAAQLLRKKVNTCHGHGLGDHDGCMPCVARLNSIFDIEHARDYNPKPWNF